MHAMEFLRRAAGVAKPIYAAYGDDPYLRREAIGAIVKAALGPDADEGAVTRLAGDHAELADVLDELRTLPFLAKRRVVVVENADPFITAHRADLERYAERPAATGVLVLAPKTWPGNTRLAKAVAKVGEAVECKAPREAELPEWLVRLAKEHEGVALDPDAARLLVELVGPEVGLLASEVAKLATYVGKAAKIRRGDVAKMVGAGRVETIWRVLDAATTGKGAEALDDLDRLLTSGEHPVGLLAAMSASLRKVHHAGTLRKARRDLNEACREAGIPPFAQELTGRQHAHLGPGRVDALPALLLRADMDLKGGSQLDPRVVLERFLLALAAPRRD
jgi:DNA polymerase-3 subunit delta